MERTWNLLEPPPQSFFDDHPELPETVATLLFHRNITTQEQIDEFLNPDYSKDVHDPFLFRDMHKAVNRLMEAIAAEETITIHGDYDADGVSASVILTDTLHAIGAKHIDVFLPHREIDGYGLNIGTVDYLAEHGTSVIITCDCGISNAAEIDHAKKRGIDVIITDHHAIPKTLPDAFATIHPGVQEETYPWKTLAGGGVAYKLAQALLRTHKESNETLIDGSSHESLEKWLLELVAVATVADMVPLLGENRTLTKYGLIVLNKTRRIGMQKLLLEARLMHNDGTYERHIDAHTIGFRIAPRINAAGRLDHSNTAYQLLVTKNGAEAVDLAYQLNQTNDERRELTDEYVEQATKQIKKDGLLEHNVIVVDSEGWNTGIVGLIASKLKSTYHKPAIAIGRKNGELTGSGRSVKGFNLIESLQDNPELFAKFGGHPMACGFTLAQGVTIAQLRVTLDAAYAEKTKNLDMTPSIDVDAEVDLDKVDWTLYDHLEQFEPFGQKNHQPVFLAKGVEVVRATPLGKQGNHIRLMVKHGSTKVRKVVGWNVCNTSNPIEDLCISLNPGDVIDILFEIGVNEWNGNRELQLTLVDVKPAT